MSYEDLKLDRQLCFPLYSAARKVTGAYTPYLEELDLTYTQYLILLVLWEGDGITVTDLGKRLYLDSGTLTPLLKKMEGKKWLRRTRSPEDQRKVIITLTEEGQRLRDEAADIPKKVVSCLPLSSDEAKDLYDLLYKILQA